MTPKTPKHLIQSQNTRSDFRVGKQIEEREMWRISAYTYMPLLGSTLCFLSQQSERMRVWVLLTSVQLLLFDGGPPQVASRRSALEVGMHHHQALSNLPSSTASCLHRARLLRLRAEAHFPCSRVREMTRFGSFTRIPDHDLFA